MKSHRPILIRVAALMMTSAMFAPGTALSDSPERAALEARILASAEEETPANMTRYAERLEADGATDAARRWAARALGGREELDATSRTALDALCARLGLQERDAVPRQPVPWRGLEHTAEWSAGVRTNQSLHFTLDDRWRQHAILLHEELLVPFREGPEAGADWADEAVELITEEIVAACRWTFAVGREDSWRHAFDLVQRGARDPFLRWMAARWRATTGDAAGAISDLEALVADLDDAPNAPFLRFVVAHSRALIAGWSGGNYERVRETCVAWAEDLADQPRHTAVLYDYAKLFVGVEDRDRLVAFEQSGADPWIALMLRGNVEKKLAWKARGTGWASEVSQDGWKAFREHLDAAAKAYQSAWLLRPDLPDAAEGMVDIVGPGSGRGALDLWFRRAIEARTDSPDAWQSYFWYGCYPRWGGSARAMRAMAQAARDAGHPDSFLPIFHVKFLSEYACDAGIDPAILFAADAEGPAALDSIRASLDNPRMGASATEPLRALHPSIAYWAGEIAEAVKANQSRGNIKPEPRDYPEPVAVHELLAKLDGPHGERLMPLEALRVARDWRKLRAGAAPVLAEAETNGWPESERRLLAEYVATARLHLAAADHKWLPLANDRASPSAWHVHAGQWTDDGPDGTRAWTVLDDNPLGESTIHPNLDVPGALSFRGTFAFAGIGTGEEHLVSIELKDLGPHRGTWSSVLLRWRKGRLGAVTGPNSQLVGPKATPQEPETWIETGDAPTEVRVRWRDGRIEVLAGPDRAPLVSVPAPYYAARSWRGPGMLIVRGRNVRATGIRVRADE